MFLQSNGGKCFIYDVTSGKTKLSLLDRFHLPDKNGAQFAGFFKVKQLDLLYIKEANGGPFVVYSLDDLKIVYQKRLDLGSPLKMLMNSQNEVFALYEDGRIEQLDVLFQFQQKSSMANLLKFKGFNDEASYEDCNEVLDQFICLPSF